MLINEKADEKLKDASRYIKNIAMDIVVVLVAIAYVFYQMVTLEPTALNPFVLLAEAFMGIICGLVIKQALGENGFSKGYNSSFWKDEEKKYNEACDSAIPFIERVDNFYQFEEIAKRKNYRRSKLQGIRLKYGDWFDKDGNYIGSAENEAKLDRKQLKVLHKCINVKIYVLNLFSEYEISAEQDTKKERKDKDQRIGNLTRNAISATAIAVIGAYFVPMINRWSWASFIGATMQVTLWILFGIVQLYTNYNYVVQDKVATMRRKKELIGRFTTECKNGQYIYGPYDEYKQIAQQ